MATTRGITALRGESQAHKHYYFRLAVASAGAGGIAMAFLYSFVPHGHNLWLVHLFLVVIVGGVGNVLGTAAAGCSSG